MNILLSPPMQNFVESKVREGEYASAEQVIEAALAALQQQRRLGNLAPGELDQLLVEGEADIAAGRVCDGEEVFRELDEMSAIKRREKSR
jgi:antitoxin ParD1/3/4